MRSLLGYSPLSSVPLPLTPLLTKPLILSKWYPLLLLLVFAGMGVLLYWGNPEGSRWFPRCIFKWATGWSCPGCGLQRALHALLHGRFLRAWQYNYLLIFTLPYAAVLIFERWFMWGRAQQRLQRIIEHPVLVYLLAVVCLSWIILRNVLGI